MKQYTLTEMYSKFDLQKLHREFINEMYRRYKDWYVGDVSVLMIDVTDPNAMRDKTIKSIAVNQRQISASKYVKPKDQLLNFSKQKLMIVYVGHSEFKFIPPMFGNHETLRNALAPIKKHICLFDFEITKASEVELEIEYIEYD